MHSKQWNERDMMTYPSKDPLVAMSHMPLSHITDRHHVYVTLFNGGRVGVVYDSVKLMESIGHAKFRLLCGGRLKLFVSGGAALDGETRKFLQNCFRVPEVIDGYGSVYHSFIHISHKSMTDITLERYRYGDRKHRSGWKDSRWSRREDTRCSRVEHVFVRQTLSKR